MNVERINMMVPAMDSRSVEQLCSNIFRRIGAETETPNSATQTARWPSSAGSVAGSEKAR